MNICYGSKGTKRHTPKIKILFLLILSTLIVAAGMVFYSNKTSATIMHPKAHEIEIKPIISKSALPIKTQNLLLEKPPVEKTQDESPKDGNTIDVNTSNQIKQPSPIAASTVKVAYLTFDDGPSRDITPQILDILNKYNLKATFFLIGEECVYNPEMVIKEKDAGNEICNHTYSHKYKTIYSSTAAFEKDLKKCDDELKSILGDVYTPKYIRFPGGAFGKKYAPVRTAVMKEGYSPISWNIDTGDSLGKDVPVEKLIENVKAELKNLPKNHSPIILMHDMAGKQTTADALPTIIEYLESEGYTFATFE